MGDQDDGFALIAQPVQNAEQVVGLGRCQNTGRFVQDQDIGFAIERLEDLDTLLRPNAQIFDQGLGVHVEFVLICK